jgi:hypothetical protein
VIRHVIPGAAGVALVALLSGCGKSPPAVVPAEGVIRLDGKPLKNVQVRFVAVSDAGPESIATGVTDEAGRFRLTCNGRPGACAGENRVVVTEGDIPKRLQGEDAQDELAEYLESLGGRPIPPKYSDLTASPLRANVTAGQQEYNFDLTR